MMRRRLLYLDAQQLSAYLWQQGHLLPEGVFEATEDGLMRFTDYLAQHSGHYFYLLVNIAEEHYALETIPFLRGKDRQTLISRRLAQHFLAAPLRMARHLSYAKDKRKNEKLLLTALGKSTQLTSCLSCFAQAEAALAGVYSVAQLSAVFLRRLTHNTAAHALLLSSHDRFVRETYLAQGVPYFSRLAVHTEHHASTLLGETNQLWQYLLSQRLISRKDRLSAVLLVHPADLPTVRAACVAHESLDFVLIDSHQAAVQLGLKTRPAAHQNEALFLHLLAIAPPRQQYADKEIRRYFHLAQLRKSLLGIGALAVLLGGIFAAWQLYLSHGLNAESAQLQSANLLLERQYSDIAATFAPLPLEYATVRRLTDRYLEFRQQQKQLAPALQRLSKALDAVPEIMLEHIDWFIGQPESTLSAHDRVVPAGEENLIVRASIQAGPKASTRQTLAIFEQFVAHLRLDPSHVVTVTQQPFELTSGHTLRDEDVEHTPGKQRQFTVHIRWQVGA